MINIQTLVTAADSFRDAAGIEKESTLSYRIFGDTKVLGNLRSGRSDITVGRFNGAMAYLARNWPEGSVMPVCLSAFDEPDAPAHTQGAA